MGDKTETAVDCGDCEYKGTISEFEEVWPEDQYTYSECPKCGSVNLIYHEFDRVIKQ